ncbi:sigma-70 family RNA polymerase sigma factor [Microbacterium hydrocarbonoxydans]|uniref:sigma-70 family RNA polymerase sigma factor n=1 Tax=Microbacterium hydrocarbonoxydans TaxID=273678 RepID=UPI003D9851ED
MNIRIEDAFRTDAGRILGAVTAYTGDLQLAEDAVQEAFARAIAQENAGEGPGNPAAWITTAARRIAVDTIRRERTAARAHPLLVADAASSDEADPGEFAFTGDERLELILTVCHPELGEETRLGLALRFACGIPTRDVASMLLVTESAMAARLTRAKRHLHESSIRFAMTDGRQVAERMPDALSVISLVFAVGYDAPARAEAAQLCADAIELARDAHRIRPDDPEAAGLLALTLLTHARRSARLDPAGELVELAAADRGDGTCGCSLKASCSPPGLSLSAQVASPCRPASPGSTRSRRSGSRRTGTRSRGFTKGSSTCGPRRLHDWHDWSPAGALLPSDPNRRGWSWTPTRRSSAEPRRRRPSRCAPSSMFSAEIRSRRSRTSTKRSSGPRTRP